MEKWTCSICGAVHGCNLHVPIRRQMMRLVCKVCNNITEHLRNTLLKEANNNGG